MKDMTFTPMDRRIRNRWIKALRSQEYEQADGQLVRDDYEYPDSWCGRPELVGNSFCCLGVLCDMRARTAPKGSGIGFDEIGTFYDGNGNADDSALSEEMREWSGLTDTEAQEKLIAMNDDEGKSFKQIANWIERNL